MDPSTKQQWIIEIGDEHASDIPGDLVLTGFRNRQQTSDWDERLHLPQ